MGVRSIPVQEKIVILSDFILIRVFITLLYSIFSFFCFFA